jgi:CheY-like chemotaxis protein
MSTANAERVLIADDDPNLLDAYLLFFEGQGYEVRTASDGVEALGQYWAWLPAIVILDIQMPRLDGWTVAKEIRRLTDGAAPLLLAVTFTNCRTVAGSDSRATSPGSASATSSNTSAIAKHVLLLSSLVRSHGRHGRWLSIGHAEIPDFARCNRNAATPATGHQIPPQSP